jgi:hypothetical protein
MADKKSTTRSAKEIEADLAATRERLSRTVDELSLRVTPADIKRRQVEALRLRANEAAFTPDGKPRYDRLAGGLGVAAAGALVLGLARRAFHRG